MLDVGECTGRHACVRRSRSLCVYEKHIVNTLPQTIGCRLWALDFMLSALVQCEMKAANTIITNDDRMISTDGLVYSPIRGSMRFECVSIVDKISCAQCATKWPFKKRPSRVRDSDGKSGRATFGRARCTVAFALFRSDNYVSTRGKLRVCCLGVNFEVLEYVPWGEDYDRYTIFLSSSYIVLTPKNQLYRDNSLPPKALSISDRIKDGRVIPKLCRHTRALSPQTSDDDDENLKTIAESKKNKLLASKNIQKDERGRASAGRGRGRAGRGGGGLTSVGLDSDAHSIRHEPLAGVQRSPMLYNRINTDDVDFPRGPLSFSGH
ncbi:hypothetical protein EVAR_4957_1 [Eumeta japonica]|uniref:Uncharacterized protein n=1 Tax=Eumeta variegata TaxID=151549 RepID=A0A4C1UZ38_EUMVA|nr:hypothetical protein EVAR_4957_1 [Eumeta japonica]